MRTSAFWVSGTTQLGCTVTDDGYKGLIFRILIVLGLYYLSIMRKHRSEADQVCDYRPQTADLVFVFAYATIRFSNKAAQLKKLFHSE